MTNGQGPTEIRTRVAGFKVQSDNHYTMEPQSLRPFSSPFLISMSKIEKENRRMLIT